MLDDITCIFDMCYMLYIKYCKLYKLCKLSINHNT